MTSRSESSDLDALNALLDAAVADRVAAHREREARTIGVPEYLRRLKAVRDVEDEFEPQRRALGAVRSRAWELVEAEKATGGPILGSEMRAARALGRPVPDGRMSPRKHLSRSCDCQRPAAEPACGSCPSRAIVAQESAVDVAQLTLDGREEPVRVPVAPAGAAGGTLPLFAWDEGRVPGTLPLDGASA